jgi:ribose transport system substrate-binding protein
MLSPKATVSKVLVLGAVAALAAACSSSTSSSTSSSSTSSSSTSSSSTSSSGTTSGSGTNTAACTAVQPFLSPPKTIPLDTPLTKKPPTGKTIVVTENPEAVTIKTNEGLIQGAHMLGWTVKKVEVGSTAEGPQQAFSAALQLHPDAILVSGNPEATLRAQMTLAAQAGIPVLMSDNGDPVAYTGSTYTIGLDSDSQTALWGKMTADYAACNGAKHVLVVDLPLYPILHAYSQGVVSEMAKIAPNVKTTVLTTQITDLTGGKISSQVISQIQRNPDINWVLFCLGDMTTGLAAALRDAGLAGKVKIGGESASTANVQALKAGTDAAWTGFAAQIHGMYRIDALARIFNHESLAPDNNLQTVQLPTQLLTPQNINSAPLDSTGYYVGVPRYPAHFATLWKVNG